MDEIDEHILSLLLKDGRRTYDDIGRQVGLSASAVKRRIDHLRERGVVRGFTAVLGQQIHGWNIEAIVRLYYASGTLREQAAEGLAGRPEIVQVWMVSGDADALAHVRARDVGDLERLLLDLKKASLVERTRSEIVMSQLIPPQPISIFGSTDDANSRASS